MLIVMASMAACAQPPPPVIPPGAVFTAKSPAVPKQPVKKTVKVFSTLNPNLLKPHPQTGASDKIVRVDGMSSQPWYRMAGTKPGWSAFPSPEQRDPSLNFFWVGAEPSR